MVTGTFFFLKARRQRNGVGKEARKQRKWLKKDAITRSIAVTCPL